MSFSVNDLRTFTLVAHERSVSGAAQILGVAQQSVSERIRRLERRLGVDLFVRRPHGMSPSAAGYRFLPYAQRILALVDEAAGVLDEDDVVRVSVQQSVAATVVPFVEASISDVTLKFFQEVDSARVLASVADGTCDVGFGSFAIGEGPLGVPDRDGPSADLADAARFPSARDIVIERAFDDPVVCVGTPDHPLASRGPLHFSELPGWGVALGAGADGAAAMARPGEDGQSAVALYPRSNVASELADGTLVELEVVDLPEWVVPIHVAYRSSDRDRPLVGALREIFGGSLPSTSLAGATAVRDVEDVA